MTTNADLIQIINDLRSKVKALQNKENVNPNARKNRTRQIDLSKQPWQYCWTHGTTKSHCSANCNNPMPSHAATATLKDRKGGSA